MDIEEQKRIMKVLEPSSRGIGADEKTIKQQLLEWTQGDNLNYTRKESHKAKPKQRES